MSLYAIESLSRLCRSLHGSCLYGHCIGASSQWQDFFTAVGFVVEHDVASALPNMGSERGKVHCWMKELQEEACVR